jgi:antitoxin MazE
MPAHDVQRSLCVRGALRDRANFSGNRRSRKRLSALLESGRTERWQIRTTVVFCTYVIKKLTRTGNSVALVLDKQLLEAANLNPDDQVEVSTNGRVIVISPVRSKRETEAFERGQELMHAKFAGAFRRLAK